MLTVYVSNKNVDLKTIKKNVSSDFSIEIVDEWTKEIPELFTYHCGIFLLKKEAVNVLKKHTKVKINRNVYPKEHEDETSLFVKMNAQEKLEVDRLIKYFTSATKTEIPTCISDNKVTFYKFKTKELVPTVLGMLRNYPVLSKITIKYAWKEKNQNLNVNERIEKSEKKSV